MSWSKSHENLSRGHYLKKNLYKIKVANRLCPLSRYFWNGWLAISVSSAALLFAFCLFFKAANHQQFSAFARTSRIISTAQRKHFSRGQEASNNKYLDFVVDKIKCFGVSTRTQWMVQWDFAKCRMSGDKLFYCDWME